MHHAAAMGVDATRASASSACKHQERFRSVKVVDVEDPHLIRRCRQSADGMSVRDAKCDNTAFEAVRTLPIEPATLCEQQRRLER